MALNLKIGECVHYGAHGVCRVSGQETKKIGRQEEVYYTLCPTSSENILLYLPAGVDPEKVKLRRLLPKDQILELIREAQTEPPQWIADNKARREIFSQILRDGETKELIYMLRNLYIHQEELPPGKMMPVSDQEMMAAARRQLHSELSYVLEIEESQVLPFVMEQVREVRERQERQRSAESGMTEGPEAET